MNTKQSVIDFCSSLELVYLDYPFDENWAAMRHIDGKKTFAFIYDHDGKTCVNLKCEPERAYFLRQVFPAVLPAYHMNKEHWITVLLGGVPDGELTGMIIRSYELTRKRR